MAEIFRIDSHTWRLEDGSVRFFLLEGEDRAALLDSGMNCPEAAELAKSLTDKPLLLLTTHGDGDHISGAGSFPEIYMHREDYLRCGVGERFPETALHEAEDGEVIELGNRPLKIIFIPGHTYGSIAVLDVKNRVLYSGDSVQKGHIYMFGCRRDRESFEGSLDRLIALQGEYDRIYACHDEYEVPGNYAEKVKAVWQSLGRGELPYESIVLGGTPVKSYTAEACGFYMD